MFLLLVCLLSAFLISNVTSNNTVHVQGNVKIILESVQTNCDHDFVEYFHKVPDTEMLYTFHVVKEASKFWISIIIRALSSQRIMYRINKMDGCQFLNNPLTSKVLLNTLKAISANKTIFKCPIAPKVYFLKNMAQAKIIPAIHPAGRFQMNVQMQMSLSKSPFVMEVIWKYSVMHLK